MIVRGDILVVHVKAKFLLRNKEVKLFAMSSNQNYILFVEVRQEVCSQTRIIHLLTFHGACSLRLADSKTD